MLTVVYYTENRSSNFKSSQVFSSKMVGLVQHVFRRETYDSHKLCILLLKRVGRTDKHMLKAPWVTHQFYIQVARQRLCRCLQLLPACFLPELVFAFGVFTRSLGSGRR